MMTTTHHHHHNNTAPDRVHLLEASEREVAARHAATALRNRLRLNSAFSFATGLVGLALGGAIADWFAVEQAWIVRAVGGALVCFAVLVAAVAGSRTATLSTWSARISIADLGWVGATPVVIAFGGLSTAGWIVMAAIGVVVLDLAIGQLTARRRLVRARERLDDRLDATLEESPPIEMQTSRRVVVGTPDELWPIITDHGLYARLALNLKAAENLTPNGPGFERSCTDSAGRSWSETCTLWQPGRRFDVDVDTSDYPYPLQVMQGSWRVDPIDDTRSTVTMVFAFQPTPGLAGRLMVPVMHLLFPPILRRIAKGWEAAFRARATGVRRSTRG